MPYPQTIKYYFKELFFGRKFIIKNIFGGIFLKKNAIDFCRFIVIYTYIELSVVKMSCVQ